MKKIAALIMFLCTLVLFAACAGTQKTVYTITFDGNGQEISVAPQTVEEGAAAQEPDAPSVTGYTFGGWYMNEECTGEAYDFQTAVHEDLTLYARWSREETVISVFTAEEFFAMQDGNYRLENDIDFSGTDFTAVGTLSKPFSGTLDGNGHTLKVSGALCVFGCVTGTVRDLTVQLRVAEGGNVGTVYCGMVGFLRGGRVENCAVDAQIDISASDTRLSVYAGGIAGRNAGGTVEKCVSDAVLTVENTANVYVGGVVGYNGGEADVNGIVRSSSHYGSVSAKASADTASAYAGGVVGFNAGAVSDSFDISALVLAECGDYHAYAGGVAGDNNGGSLTRCFSAADVTCVTSGGDTFMGGVTGRNFLDYVVEDCYGWDGQEFTLTRTGELLPTARHLRVPCATVSAAELNDEAWYGALGLEGWLVRDGVLPGQDFAEGASFARAAKLGTAGNPIAVGSAEELRSMDYGKAYILTADIELGDWTPVGTYLTPFVGSLDGAGHRLYGIRAQEAGGYAGLFGYLNGTVKNLRTEISYTPQQASDGQLFAGGIAAFGMSARIENCTSEVNFVFSAFGAAGAGICGYADGAVISECGASGTVRVTSTSPASHAAGVCAVNAGGILERCASDVYVAADGVNGCSAGGVAAVNAGTVRDCYAWGAVQAGSSQTPGEVLAGGIVGSNTGTLENSYAIGRVTGAGGVAASGTVCGANEGMIGNCYAAQSETGLLGYSPNPFEAYAVSETEFSALAARLNASRSVWKDGSEGFPVLAWQED